MKQNYLKSLILIGAFFLALSSNIVAQVSYCTAFGKVQYYEYIDYISIGTITRASGAEAGGYFDATALSTDVIKGADYILTFSHANPAGGYTENFAVFIDWNSDGDFADADENVLATTTYTTANYTATITIPLTAITGLTRMRVCMESALFAAPLACGKFTYGEVEDYSLNILGDITCSETLEPNNSKGSAKPIPANTEISSQISTSKDIDWLSFSNNAAEPNIQVLLTTVPANYNIKLYAPGGALVGTSNATGLSNEIIVYNTAIIGTYKIKVFGAGGSFSNVACYTLAADINATPYKSITSLENNDAPEIEVYPMPAGNEFTLLYNGAEGKALIRIYNEIGQIVYTKYVDLNSYSNTLIVNSSSWENGIYYLELLQGTKSVKKQILITK